MSDVIGLQGSESQIGLAATIRASYPNDPGGDAFLGRVRRSIPASFWSGKTDAQWWISHREYLTFAAYAESACFNPNPCTRDNVETLTRIIDLAARHQDKDRVAGESIGVVLGTLRVACKGNAPVYQRAVAESLPGWLRAVRDFLGMYGLVWSATPMQSPHCQIPPDRWAEWASLFVTA